ncbi:3-oxoacyl-[acyl-carrier-protein] synthase-3 [Amphibacillus marinus]|uniref:3-oxoacyl-[acyl-carrier-protein] synthase-3 n=1 Tax=Amphibacillus marinus TaxID=872970 RepID=A0A1H8LAK3_9BACI|nr:3-oxoacyl-[acyl-carrier-protein] synthase III C-terminal domain-containing protein [Amphibacillus marinus]SEO01738.1 3-oxoacyl-[acyl-carrier-protein] synthase-3 [Amphibacillus marinus]
MKLTLIGSGRYLPERIVYSHELDEKFGFDHGETEKRTGVHKRHFFDQGTSRLAKQAILQALADADLTYQDIDALICASGTFEQPIPCTASLIAEKFLTENHPIPCFDVNATCLSFLTACDIAQAFLATHKYKKILVVSAEAGDDALNPEAFESYALIGNASAAFIFSTEQETTAKFDLDILSSKFITYPEYAHDAEIKAGGNGLYHPEQASDRYFHMNGFNLLKSVKHKLPAFLADLYALGNVAVTDIDFVVPHQASGAGLMLASRLAQFKAEQVVNILSETGNTIAASIPYTLDYLLKREKNWDQKIVMLLGTGAGLSIGGQILRVRKR